MPDFVPWLIGIAMLALIAFAFAAGRFDPAPPKPRPHHEPPAVCASCIHRAGDDCTHPSSSPVSGQECGPVCKGEPKCKVTEGHNR